MWLKVSVCATLQGGSSRSLVANASLFGFVQSWHENVASHDLQGDLRHGSVVGSGATHDGLPLSWLDASSVFYPSKMEVVVGAG